MSKRQFFRHKKVLLLLVAMGIAVSFSACSKTTDSGTLENTVWRAEVDDAVIELHFDDDKTCSISNGHKNAYSMNFRRYDYERGYGVDLFILEKGGEEKGETIYIGSFGEQNELTLFDVVDNVATHTYVTLKKIK
jgi:hypothetical protein